VAGWGRGGEPRAESRRDRSYRSHFRARLLSPLWQEPLGAGDSGADALDVIITGMAGLRLFSLLCLFSKIDEAPDVEGESGGGPSSARRVRAVLSSTFRSMSSPPFKRRRE
jgi:hypothetical protein